MAHATVDVQDIPLTLEEKDVWACLGSRGRSNAALAPEVSRAVELACELSAPRGVSVHLAVAAVGRNRVLFERGPVLEGAFLAHCVQGASEAAFSVVTIGPALEQMVSDLFSQGDMTAAFLLDAAGSAAVMNAFTHLANGVRRRAAGRGWSIGLCLFPGQRYWDISGQRTILGAAPAERIGVKLLESCLMVPQKTQSALIPVGPDLKVQGDPNLSYCRLCGATRCPMRHNGSQG